MRREQGIAAPLTAGKAGRPIKIPEERGGGDQILKAQPVQPAEAPGEIQRADRHPGRNANADHAARPKRRRAKPESASFRHGLRGAIDNQKA